MVVGDDVLVRFGCFTQLRLSNAIVSKNAGNSIAALDELLVGAVGATCQAVIPEHFALGCMGRSGCLHDFNSNIISNS